MPYITQEDRRRLEDGGAAETPGDLAYLVYCLMVDWVHRSGNSLSFSRASQAIGVLEAAKLEFYRRLLSAYEDGKCCTNGDVTVEDAQRAVARLRGFLFEPTTDHEKMGSGGTGSPTDVQSTPSGDGTRTG